MPHILLLASGLPVLRNGDVHYPFRVDSDFLAWTGLSLPWAIVLIDLTSREMTLFFDEPDDFTLLWEGKTWDREKIRELWFRGDIFPRSSLEFILQSLKGDFLLPDISLPSTESEYRLLRELLAGRQITSADRYLIEKRLVKSEKDIETIRKAIEITHKTYRYITQNVQIGMYEYEIAAMIQYQFVLERWIEAFPAVVASGENTCTLHHWTQNRKIIQWDLILLDFGIELDGYGADISRTFPIDWVFSPRQLEIYDAVLMVKSFAEKMLVPGTTRNIWKNEVKVYMHEICKVLWLPNIDQYSPQTNPYFPHSIGHYLGLDTHDIGDSDIPLMPGMVMTIEPGIYIREEAIGVRIEDDYLITSDGCIRL